MPISLALKCRLINLKEDKNINFQNVNLSNTQNLLSGSFLKDNSSLEVKAQTDMKPENKTIVLFDPLKHLDIIKNNLDVDQLELIAKGAFGQVFVSKNKTNEKFAYKVIQAEYSSPNYLAYWKKNSMREIYYSSILKHDNISKFYDHFWFGTNLIEELQNCLALKMEYLDTSLHELISSELLNAQETVHLAKEVCLLSSSNSNTKEHNIT